MEFETVLRGRRSIRAYTLAPVNGEAIGAILDAARWSPSWRNTQAWNI
jgi:nitroreductase